MATVGLSICWVSGGFTVRARHEKRFQLAWSRRDQLGEKFECRVLKVVRVVERALTLREILGIDFKKIDMDVCIHGAYERVQLCMVGEERVILCCVETRKALLKWVVAGWLDILLRY